MTVSRGEVDRIARLARLRLDPAEAARITGELNTILAHMAELAPLDVTGVEAEGVAEGPAPYRDPDAGPDPLQAPLERIAPDWREGFFVVPRLPAMEGMEEDRRGEAP